MSLSKDVLETIHKYTNIFNVFLSCIDSVPIKGKTKKEYCLPVKTMLELLNASGNVAMDHASFCKFVKDHSQQYIDTLKTEIAKYDMKFIQILDRFEKSEYYKQDRISVAQQNLITARNNGKHSLPEINVHSSCINRELPLVIQYQLRSEEYSYPIDKACIESEISNFIAALLKDANMNRTTNEQQWNQVKKFVPQNLSDELLELAIQIENQTTNQDRLMLFNCDMILQKIVETIPYLQNANRDNISHILKLKQFELFFMTNECLRELLEIPDFDAKMQLSNLLLKMGLDKYTKNNSLTQSTVSDLKPKASTTKSCIINIDVKCIDFMKLYFSVSAEKRLMIKTFFPYKNGHIFLKDCDTTIIKRFVSISDISVSLGVSIYVISNGSSRMINNSDTDMTIILFMDNVKGLATGGDNSNKKMFNIVFNKDNQFLHINFKVPSPNLKFITFEQFQQNNPYLTLENAFEKYQTEYATDYFVPSTFDSAFLGYLNNKMLLYGTEETNDTFIVFSRFRVPKEPLKSQYHKVYNLVRSKPPVPTIQKTIRSLLDEKIIISLYDLFTIWLNCAKNSGISNLIERSDGYQTVAGYFCRESDVWKSNIYQQDSLKYWDLQRVPFLSIHEIHRSSYVPKNICLFSCLASHWTASLPSNAFGSRLETVDNSVNQFSCFQENILNTQIPIDIDVALDSKLRPRYVSMENLTLLQILPYILKFGPVIRLDGTTTSVTQSSDSHFFTLTLYIYMKWNLGLIDMNTIKEILEPLLASPAKYLIREADCRFIQVENLLPQTHYQFPPLPCYVKLFTSDSETNSQSSKTIGVLYSYDEEKDEYIVRCGTEIQILARDEFQFYEKSRILPYPIKLNSDSKRSFNCELSDSKGSSSMVGKAVKHIDGDVYLVTVENDISQHKMSWNTHFEWDDQKYVIDHTPPPTLGQPVYVKDIHVDKNKNRVADTCETLAETYVVPNIYDRTNNPPFFDLFHPSSRFCILPFLHFVGIKSFMKSDQNMLLQKVLSQPRATEGVLSKKCLDSNCLLVQSAIILWLQATQDRHSLEQLTIAMGKLSTIDSERDQLYSSLREFLSVEQLKAIVWESMETAYSVLYLIISKLYPNVHMHHSYHDLWLNVTGVNVTKSIEMIPDQKTITRKIIETDYDNVSDIDPVSVFTLYPDALSLFYCYLEQHGNEEKNRMTQNAINDVFWFNHKWYNSVMNISEACKFRDQVWSCLLKIPGIIHSLSNAQKERMFRRLNVKSITDIYSGGKDKDTGAMLLNVVKYLESLSLFG